MGIVTFESFQIGVSQRSTIVCLPLGSVAVFVSGSREADTVKCNNWEISGKLRACAPLDAPCRIIYHKSVSRAYPHYATFFTRYM